MRRLFLIAALALTATPVLAQEATPAPATAAADQAAPAPQPAAPKSEEELAIQAQAVAFNASIKAMQDEMVAAPRGADFEPMIASRRVEASALADRMSAFMTADVAKVENAEERAALEANIAERIGWVRNIPDLVATTVKEGLEKARAGVPADAAAPATETRESPDPDPAADPAPKPER